jgi:hypothetical protein
MLFMIFGAIISKSASNQLLRTEAMASALNQTATVCSWLATVMVTGEHSFIYDGGNNVKDAELLSD